MSFFSKNRLLLSCFTLLFLALFYFTYNRYSKRRVEPIDKAQVESDLSSIAYYMARLFLASSTSFSAGDLSFLDASYSIMANRIDFYKPLISRLEKDDDIKALDIHPWIFHLYFLNYNTKKSHDAMGILLERPFKRRLRALLERRQKVRRKKSKARDIYASFLTRDSLRRGYRFLRKERKLLSIMEKRYSVGREFLVAILFVETQFGKVLGDNVVLNVYNSLYHYDDSKLFGSSKESFLLQEENNLYIKKDIGSVLIKDKPSNIAGNAREGFESFFVRSINDLMYPYLTKPFSPTKLPLDLRWEEAYTPLVYDRDIRVSSSISTDFAYLSRYVNRKKEWAYEQLKSLFIMHLLYDIDIHNIKGSWAGAFGFCQFIPSSYLAFAKDGDGDGIINLFILSDALASAAHYLKEAGFKNNDRKSIRKAIYNYNYSSSYVNTVYNYARSLQKMQKMQKRKWRKARRRRIRSRINR